MADLFSDGFESGDLTGWDSSDNGTGDLTVHADAAIHGSYGAKFVVNNQNAMYVQDDTPATEARYRCRFYLDPNGVSMADNSEFEIFRGIDESWGYVTFKIVFCYESSAYQIKVLDYTDAGDWSKMTATWSMSDAPHCVEVDWKVATGVGQNDGEIKLWIDGVLKETVSSIDNDTHNVGHVRLEIVEFSATPTGTVYMDDFASNDDGSEIGQMQDISGILSSAGGIIKKTMITVGTG